MNKEQILSWLPLIGVKPHHDQSRGGWVVSKCPCFWNHDGESSSPSFAVRIEAGDSFCNCFSCGYHGSQADLVVELGFRAKQSPPKWKLNLGDAMQLIAQSEDGVELDLDSPDIEQVLFGKKDEHIFGDDWLASFKPALSMKWSREYLADRQVTYEIAEALDIRADSVQRRICFPVRDFKGRLRGLHGRAVEPAVEPRWRMFTYKGRNNPHIWLGEHYVEFERPIVVVEGPFDLTSVARVYDNVVSPLFANPSLDKLKRMRDAHHWITLLDHGAGGDKGRQRISKELPNNLITHLLPPEGRKDPNEMSLMEMIELLEPYVELNGPSC